MARKRPTPWTPEKEAQFLSCLGDGFSVSRAAKQAGFARQTVYERRERTPGFSLAWAEAVEAGSDVLEDEALRRAVEGTDKPIFYEGEQVAVVREYSDTLLIFLLKGRRPSKFRDRHEITGPGEGPLQVLVKYADH